MKKLKQSENRTTYFTWIYKNDYKATSDDNLKKVHVASSMEELGEVIVNQVHDRDLLPYVTKADCPLFSVEYNWEYREVLLSYYYAVADPSKTSVYRAVLDRSMLVARTKVFSVAEGTCGILNYGDDDGREVDFSVIPEQVLECCYKEIRRMQGIKERFPYTLMTKKSRTLLKTTFVELAVSYNRKLYTLNLLEAITTHPYIPFVPLMLKETYIFWEGHKKAVEKLIENLDVMSPSSYKEFFKRLGIKPSIRFRYEILEDPGLALEYIHFNKDCGFTDKRILKFLSEHSFYIVNYNHNLKDAEIKNLVNEHGDKWTKETLLMVASLWNNPTLEFYEPDGLAKCLEKIINRKC